nr:hypothetical protein Itr_chr05CG08240 [Ipomoea trifida]
MGTLECKGLTQDLIAPSISFWFLNKANNVPVDWLGEKLGFYTAEDQEELSVITSGCRPTSLVLIKFLLFGERSQDLSILSAGRSMVRERPANQHGDHVYKVAL